MTLPAPRADLGLREGYHSPQVEVEVRLNVNESPFAPPDAWMDEYVAGLRKIEWHRYPERAATALREAIADLHGVRADQVFCANGSNEVLQSICLAYGGPGRKVATFEPTYALHSHIAHLTGTGVCSAGRRDDFSLDPDVVTDLIATEAPAITFVCSPNNPTGTAEDRSMVRAVIDAAPGLVVVDEAYGQFADWSAVDLVADDSPLLVTRTFSKTWSMAALRLGYVIGAAPVIEMLERVTLPYHIDAGKQLAGRLAVQYRQEMNERVAILVRERQRLFARLAALPVTTWPSQANFILFKPAVPADQVWQELVNRSILVRNTASWPGLEGCLRVTVGTPEENDRFLAALTEILS